MRRKDREMDRAFAENVFDACTFATLSTVSSDGTPYAVPVSIAREGGSVYFHCALEGKKIDNLRFNNKVCLSCVGKTHIPEKKFTIGFESAIAFGTACEISNEEEKIHALRLISLRYMPDNMENFDDAVSRTLKAVGVWKVHIDSISGKQNKTE